MISINERDEKIEKNAGIYRFIKMLFLILFVLSFIALIGAKVTNDTPEIFAKVFWVTLTLFLIYKLASFRIKHIETIRYHKQNKPVDNMVDS